MNLIYSRFMGPKTIYYYDEPMALDIETSNTDIITWISSIQVYFLGEYYLFRTPKELVDFLKDIIVTYNLYYKYRLMVIIHNASYDLSYLIGYFQKYLPDKEDRSILKRDRNNTISYRQGGLVFRDTYALVNTSLEKWGKDLNIEHKKKVGYYDYDKLIYQDTELTDSEKQYDRYDVLSLYECFQTQLAIHGDTVATVPYTSTGYVRRDCEKECRKDKYYRNKYFVENALSLEQFNLTVRAFSGGYTHNNRFFAEQVIKALIGHRDFRSMYPSELRNKPMPFGRPRMIYDISQKVKRLRKIDVDYILSLYPEYSSITLIEIFEAKLRDDKISMPFMQHSKMNILSQEWCLKDNGRILSFKGKAFIAVDNLLLQILKEQYKMKLRICKCLTFKNEMLPAPLVTLIDNYFKGKTDYKDIHEYCLNEYGELDARTIEAAINLMLRKQKLNGIYGMFVQNPLQDEYDLDYDKFDFLQVVRISDMTEEEKGKKLDEFYHNRKKVLPYQVGVFVTAQARYELYQYIKAIGYDKCLYCDTDSIFYLKDEKTEKAIERLNNQMRKAAIKNKAYIISDKGKKVYYDEFCAEPDLQSFKGLHSKCYAYITASGEFKATIAGVPARSIIGMDGDKPIYLLREEELSGINAKMKLQDPKIRIDNDVAMENLKEGFAFKTNTGTTCNYQNFMLHSDMKINIDGHIIDTFGGAVISRLAEKQIKDIDNDDIIAKKGEF